MADRQETLVARSRDELLAALALLGVEHTRPRRAPGGGWYTHITGRAARSLPAAARPVARPALTVAVVGMGVGAVAVAGLLLLAGWWVAAHWQFVLGVAVVVAVLAGLVASVKGG